MIDRRQFLMQLGIVGLSRVFNAKPIFALENYNTNWGEFERDIGNLAFYQGIKKNIFLENNVHVSVVNFGGGPAMMSAAASGDIDMGVIGPPGIVAISRGIKIKLVSSGWTSKPYFFVIAERTINDVQDLRGKTVGINQFGSGYDLALREILNANGLTPMKDVEIISLGSGIAPFAALQHKKVNAAVVKEHLVSQAESMGLAHLIASEWDYLPKCHQTSIFASQKFIESKKDIIQSVLKAYWSSQKYFIDNINESIEFGSSLLGVSQDIIFKAITRFKPHLRESGIIHEEEFSNTVDTLIRYNMLSKKIPFSDAVDLRFLPN